MFNPEQLLCPIAYELLSYLAGYTFIIVCIKSIIQELSQCWIMKSIHYEEINSTGTKGFIAFSKNMHVVYEYIFILMNKMYSSGTITQTLLCQALKIVCHKEMYHTGSSLV